MNTKAKLPHLLIAVDPGASDVKIAGSLAGDDQCVPFTIDPYCLEIEKPVLDAHFDENSVWVTVGGISYAVGNLAIAKYRCPLEIMPLKIKSIVPKICAAIAVLHRKFNLPQRFELSISSVLPPGEYAYADDVRIMLIKALRRLDTPAGAIKPVVQSIDIYSEGCGVMDWHQTRGMAKKKDVGVIMLGFRNASVLFSRKGVLSQLKSSNLGFHSVLAKISATSGGNYPEVELILPVWRYLINGDESGFKRVVICDFDLEMSKIRPAVENAMLEYRRSLETWLKSAMQQTDLVVLCGGNADYIGKSLDPFLQQYVEDLPTGSIFRHIGASSIPDEIMATGMPHRFLDIFCLWVKLNNSCKVEV